MSVQPGAGTIIPFLKRACLKVGATKRDAHRFEVDHPGKDSWRFTHAGADTMVITSAGQLAMVKSLERPKTVLEIAEELFGRRGGMGKGRMGWRLRTDKDRTD